MLSRQRFGIPVAVDTPRFLSRGSVYKVPKTVIIETLRHLLDAEEFAFLDRHAILEEPSPPRFILTGSSARKLRRGGMDLLGGRAVHRTMHPFMAAELPEFGLDRALRIGIGRRTPGRTWTSSTGEPAPGPRSTSSFTESRGSGRSRSRITARCIPPICGRCGRFGTTIRKRRRRCCIGGRSVCGSTISGACRSKTFFAGRYPNGACSPGCEPKSPWPDSGPEASAAPSCYRISDDFDTRTEACNPCPGPNPGSHRGRT